MFGLDDLDVFDGIYFLTIELHSCFAFKALLTGNVHSDIMCENSISYIDRVQSWLFESHKLRIHLIDHQYHTYQVPFKLYNI